MKAIFPSPRQESDHMQVFYRTGYSCVISTTFSVLTLNFWNVNPPLDARYAALEAGLKRLRPGIVGLQEKLNRDPKLGQSQSELIARMCGHTHAVEDKGLAIARRFPVVRSHSAPLPEFPGDFPRRLYRRNC